MGAGHGRQGLRALTFRAGAHRLRSARQLGERAHRQRAPWRAVSSDVERCRAASRTTVLPGTDQRGRSARAAARRRAARECGLLRSAPTAAARARLVPGPRRVNKETSMREQRYPQDIQKLIDAGANRDPLSGESGAHPLGVGVGAAAAGLAVGAAVGTVAGPIGTTVGAAFGAIAGGLMGKDVAELADPTAEGVWWREHYGSRDYVRPDAIYADYGPAYVYGVEVYVRRRGGRFEDIEHELAAGWEDARERSHLAWEDARHAVRDAWNRVRARDTAKK
jgi:hypothetical protein